MVDEKSKNADLDEKIKWIGGGLFAVGLLWAASSLSKSSEQESDERRKQEAESARQRLRERLEADRNLAEQQAREAVEIASRHRHDRLNQPCAEHGNVDRCRGYRNNCYACLDCAGIGDNELLWCADCQSAWIEWKENDDYFWDSYD